MSFLLSAPLLILLVPVFVIRQASGGMTVTKIGDDLVDAKALTVKGTYGESINGKSFQQDALLSHAGYQYLGYYDAQRRVCIARRRLPRGKWEIIRFTDYVFRSDDVHNTISLGICPRDSTMHIAFDSHVTPIHYRVSRKGAATKPPPAWTADLFGPIRNELEPGKPVRVTYPRFLETPDGGLQLCYRRGGSGNGDRMLVDYDPDTGTWRGTRQIDSGKGTFRDSLGVSTSRCSYPNGYTYGPFGKLHVTWVWRENPGDANHDLCYAYSEDRGFTWRNNAGEILPGPPSVESPGIVVVPIPRTYGLMNTHGQTVDNKGRVHVVMWHCTDASLAAAGSKPGQHRWGPPAARRNFHYWRDLDGTWHQRELPGVAGTAAKIVVDREDNAFVIYNLNGKFVLLGATAKTHWTDWAVIHVEEGPFLNEVLVDPIRWKQDHVLSVLAHELPSKPRQPTPLRVLEFGIRTTRRDGANP